MKHYTLDIGALLNSRHGLTQKILCSHVADNGCVLRVMSPDPLYIDINPDEHNIVLNSINNLDMMNIICKAENMYIV